MLFASHRQTSAPVGGTPWRYWRWNFTAAQGGNLYIELNEVWLFRGSTNLLPVMTGPTTSGVTITAQSADGAFPAWQVADGQQTDPAKSWNSTGIPVWLQVDFGAAPQYANGYAFRTRNNINPYWPADWTLSVSDDASTWVEVDARSGQSWTQNQYRAYSIGG